MPHLAVPPMFAQNIGRIELPRGVVETADAFGDGFTHTVEGQHVVTFVKLGMWLGGTVSDRFIVTKHDGLVLQGNTQACKTILYVDGENITVRSGNRLGATSLD